MTEPDHEIDPSRLVRFEWKLPDDLSSPQRCVAAVFGTARLHVDFDDSEQGSQDLRKVIMAMPTIVMHLREEVKIQREVDTVDQDLLDLLGEGEVETDE